MAINFNVKLVLLSCSLTVQYAVHLYQYFKKWRKNPKLSFSCCLEVLLPLNNLQGEVSALAEINQLQSGQEKMSAIVTRENADQVGNNSMEVQDGSESNIKKCHQGTQTNLSVLQIA